MTTQLTALTLPANAQGSLTTSLAWQPGGTLLAQVHQYLPDYTNLATRAGAWKLWLYTLTADRSGVQLAGTVPAPPAGRPAMVGWHPTGKWMLVGCSNRDDEGFDTMPVTFKTRVYGSTDNTVWTEVASDPDLWGVYLDGQLSFDASGQWLAAGSGDQGGVNGLVSFDPATGATHVVAGFPDGRAAAAVAWHPTDTTLLARVDTGGEVRFFRRTGSTLATVSGSYLDAVTATGIRWHPSGTFFTIDNYDAESGQSNQILVAYSWPGVGQLGQFNDFPQVFAGFAFDPAGALLAGGFSSTPGGGCGPGDPVGLVVDTLDTTGPAPVATLLARPYLDSGQRAGGQYLSFTTTGGVLYLAVSGFDYDPAGFLVYRIDTGPTSSLYMKQPDGAYVIVGVDGQPLSFRLPDGTMRTWPGSDLPLYMKQADGTWKQVIG